MMNQITFRQRVTRLETLIARKFGVSEGDLPTRLRKVGRQVPKSVHRNAMVVYDAAQIAGHPKRAMQIDATKVDAAFEAARAHLDQIDVRDRRKGKVIGVTATILFNLLIVLGLLLLVLIWRGFV